MKRLYSLIITLALIITLSGCSDPPVDIPIKTSTTAMRQNTEPSPQGYIYYSDGNSVRRKRRNSLVDEAFTDFYSTFLFVIDNWVYYTDNENHPEYPDVYKTSPVIHRRNEDGSIDECISGLPAMNVGYKDGYIYYIPYYGSSKYNYGKGLYRINPDGSGEMQIFADSINDYYFDDGYIYIEIAGSDILRMDINGGECEKIIDSIEYSAAGISDVAFDDKHIYFTADLFGEYLDNRYLYRANKDGSEKIQLTDMSTCDFIVSGGYIYYIAAETCISDRYLYKMTIDGNNKTRIGLRNVSYDWDYLQYDGTYIYVYLVDSVEYDPMSGIYEQSSLYKIKCDQ